MESSIEGKRPSTEHRGFKFKPVPVALAAAILFGVGFAYYKAPPCGGKYRFALGGEYYLLFECEGAGQVAIPGPGPSDAAPSREHLRIVVQSMTLGLKGKDSELTALLSISNIGSGALLLRSVGVILNATSIKDGSVLTTSHELARGVTIDQGEIVPYELLNMPVAWVRMMHPTSQVPSWGAYSFTMYIQVQATVASTGRQVWLEIEVPKPVPMSCGYPCVAVYELNVTAGESSYKKCTAMLSGEKWELQCLPPETT